MINLTEFCKNMYSARRTDSPLRDIIFPVSKIVFETKTKEEIKTRDQIPTIIQRLSVDELNFLSQLESILSERYKGKEKFYNGILLFFTDVQYDVCNKVIYAKPIIVTYVFQKALKLSEGEGGFAKDSHWREQTFIESGVVVPFITEDNKTFLFQRRRDNGLAPVMGYIEPFDEGMRSEMDYVLPDAARKEAIEEILGDVENPSKSRIRFSKDPSVKACAIKKISIPKSASNESKYYIMDWMVPLFLSCTSRQLTEVLGDLHAKDSDEHTKKYWELSLDYDPKEVCKTFQPIENSDENPRDNIYIFPPLEVCRGLIEQGYGDYLRAWLDCLWCGNNHRKVDRSKLIIFKGQSLFFTSELLQQQRSASQVGIDDIQSAMIPLLS